MVGKLECGVGVRSQKLYCLKTILLDSLFLALYGGIKWKRRILTCKLWNLCPYKVEKTESNNIVLDFVLRLRTSSLPPCQWETSCDMLWINLHRATTGAFIGEECIFVFSINTKVIFLKILVSDCLTYLGLLRDNHLMRKAGLIIQNGGLFMCCKLKHNKIQKIYHEKIKRSREKFVYENM